MDNEYTPTTEEVDSLPPDEDPFYDNAPDSRGGF